MRLCELSAALASLTTAGVKPSAPIMTVGLRLWASLRSAERVAEFSKSAVIDVL